MDPSRLATSMLAFTSPFKSGLARGSGKAIGSRTGSELPGPPSVPGNLQALGFISLEGTAEGRTPIGNFSLLRRVFSRQNGSPRPVLDSAGTELAEGTGKGGAR